MLRQQQSTHTCYVFAHQEKQLFPCGARWEQIPLQFRPEFPIPRLMSPPPSPALVVCCPFLYPTLYWAKKVLRGAARERNTHWYKANVVLPRKATETRGVVEVFPYRVTASPPPQHKAAASLAHAGESRAVGPPGQKCWAPPEPWSIRIQLHAPHSGEETAANSSSGVFKKKKKYIYLCVTGQNPILKGF